MMIEIKNKIKNNKGYTLLFAVIVSALVISVAVSILNISKKEFLLSSSARESTYAFYAADSGLECAVYHASKGPVDANGKIIMSVAGNLVVGGRFSTTSPDLSNVKCAGDLSSPTKGGVGYINAVPGVAPLPDIGTTLKTEFHIKLSGESCAVVYVEVKYTRQAQFPTDAQVPTVIIDSYGYNNGWNSGQNRCTVGSPNRVERALHYTR